MCQQAPQGHGQNREAPASNMQTGEVLSANPILISPRHHLWRRMFHCAVWFCKELSLGSPVMPPTATLKEVGCVTCHHESIRRGSRDRLWYTRSNARACDQAQVVRSGNEEGMQWAVNFNTGVDSTLPTHSVCRSGTRTFSYFLRLIGPGQLSSWLLARL